MAETKSNKKFAFEEYILFYESTEKVTDRRLSANRWNYSICTAILVAVAVILNWGLAKPNYMIYSLIIVIILGSMATLFCSLWIGQIRDFKELNNAKFKVLNDMTHYIVFSENQNDPRVSYSPFDKEWKSLKKSKATVEISRSKIVALKSSNMEYLIPRAFKILFISVIILIFVFILFNWKVIIESLSFTIT
jgi:hypothetical protein